MSVFSLSLSLALLVIAPAGESVFSIPLLPFLRATAKQDHQHVAIAPEVNPVAGTEIDLVFEYAPTNGFHVGKIALLDASDRARATDSNSANQSAKGLRSPET
jgi:hypothetical protein